MWDQPVETARTGSSIRIIPTYVGSTDLQQTSQHCTANHSHVCGINRVKISIALLPYESFPRMWDQQRMMHDAVVVARIIPTYVGSTRFCINSADMRSNHSHVCGINAFPPSSFTRIHESFPRMWDQPPEFRPLPSSERIIPTYVGSTRVYNC